MFRIITNLIQITTIVLFLFNVVKTYTSITKKEKNKKKKENVFFNNYDTVE